MAMPIDKHLRFAGEYNIDYSVANTVGFSANRTLLRILPKPAT